MDRKGVQLIFLHSAREEGLVVFGMMTVDSVFQAVGHCPDENTGLKMIVAGTESLW